MTDTDIETRRARDRERYHRQTAERRARGLCVTCGKRPPTPERTRCEPCAAKKRPGDRARYHRQATRARGPGPLPQVRQAPARARAQPVRAVPGEGRRRRPGQGRAAARRRPSAARSCPDPRIRARAQPPRGRGAPRRGDMHHLRPGARRGGPRLVRALPGQETRRRPRPLRRGQGGGETLWRRQPGHQAPGGPRQAQAPQEGVARGGALRQLRQAAGGRGRRLLRVLQGEAPGAGAPQVCRAPRRRPLHQVRHARLRRHDLLRPLRRPPLRAAVARSAEARPRGGRYADRRARGECTDCGAPVPGGQQVRGVRRAFVSPLGSISGASRSGTRAGR